MQQQDSQPADFKVFPLQAAFQAHHPLFQNLVSLAQQAHLQNNFMAAVSAAAAQHAGHPTAALLPPHALAAAAAAAAHHPPHAPHPQHPTHPQLHQTARRKNATRETTNVLKKWLNEHKRNPYPSKQEKVFLAVITSMSLVQVSTWFANARRRLKKENKMTWSPRNRCDDDDDDEDENENENEIENDEDNDDEDDIANDELNDELADQHMIGADADRKPKVDPDSLLWRPFDG